MQDLVSIERGFRLKVISYVEEAEEEDIGLFLVEPDALLNDVQSLEAFPALLKQAVREPYFIPVVYSVQPYLPESLMPFHGSKEYSLVDNLPEKRFLFVDSESLEDEEQLATNSEQLSTRHVGLVYTLKTPDFTSMSHMTTWCDKC